jgi:hypothetical protein
VSRKRRRERMMEREQELCSSCVVWVFCDPVASKSRETDPIQFETESIPKVIC